MSEYMIKTVLSIYDTLTLPLYYLIQRPWRNLDRIEEIRSKRVNNNVVYDNNHSDAAFNNDNKQFNYNNYIVNDNEIIFTNVRDLDSDEHNTIKEFDTIDKLFAHSCEKFGKKRCLGIREDLASKEYKWFTYEEIIKRTENITKGLIEIGIKPKDKVIIFAETRVEWFLIFQSIIRSGGVVATLYANLGENGLVEGINMLDSTTIVTTTKLSDKLSKIITRLHKIELIITLDKLTEANNNLNNEVKNFKMISLEEIEVKGELSSKALSQVTKSENEAVIMFTSGSTGVPKGVLITHKNFLFAVKTLQHLLSDIKFDDNETYVAYLPLAHIFEMIAEYLLSTLGFGIGYSSAATLFDFSPGFRGLKDSIGDVNILRPTVVCMVPLILDTIKKIEEIRIHKALFGSLLDIMIDYKNYWSSKGFQTPLLNYFLCRESKKSFGGRLKYVICGGAPLNPKSHSFMKALLDVHIFQAYGATEVCGPATAMNLYDHSFGRVGGPFAGMFIKLRSWAVGGYTVKDKPNPRGEICIGGDGVANGYYNLPEETAKDFYEKDGVRWFNTGDIGEMYSDGTLRIVDRIKDIVKLQNGEYVSIGKIESQLKLCPYVNNICVVGDSNHNYLVALVQPVKKLLIDLAEYLKIPRSTDYELICADKIVIENVQKSLKNIGTANGLSRVEIPKEIKLCSENWSPDNGLLTAAMKIRRREITNFYQKYLQENFN